MIAIKGDGIKIARKIIIIFMVILFILIIYFSFKGELYKALGSLSLLPIVYMGLFSLQNPIENDFIPKDYILYEELKRIGSKSPTSLMVLGIIFGILIGSSMASIPPSPPTIERALFAKYNQTWHEDNLDYINWKNLSPPEYELIALMIKKMGGQCKKGNNEIKCWSIKDTL